MKTCSKCGTQVADTAAFCTQCGNLMASAADTPAQQATPVAFASQSNAASAPVVLLDGAAAQQPQSADKGPLYLGVGVIITVIIIAVVACTLIWGAGSASAAPEESVAFNIKADNYNGDKDSRFPLRVRGYDINGRLYDKIHYISPNNCIIKLPRGKYVAKPVASPVLASGSLYSVPDVVINLTVRNGSIGVTTDGGVDAGTAPTLTYFEQPASAIQQNQVNDSVYYLYQDPQPPVDCEAIQNTLTDATGKPYEEDAVTPIDDITVELDEIIEETPADTATDSEESTTDIITKPDTSKDTAQSQDKTPSESTPSKPASLDVSVPTVSADGKTLTTPYAKIMLPSSWGDVEIENNSASNIGMVTIASKKSGATLAKIFWASGDVSQVAAPTGSWDAGRKSCTTSVGSNATVSTVVVLNNVAMEVFSKSSGLTEAQATEMLQSWSPQTPSFTELKASSDGFGRDVSLKAANALLDAITLTPQAATTTASSGATTGSSTSAKTDTTSASSDKNSSTTNSSSSTSSKSSNTATSSPSTSSSSTKAA